MHTKHYTLSQLQFTRKILKNTEFNTYLCYKIIIFPPILSNRFRHLPKCCFQWRSSTMNTKQTENSIVNLILLPNNTEQHLEPPYTLSYHVNIQQTPSNQDSESLAAWHERRIVQKWGMVVVSHWRPVIRLHGSLSSASSCGCHRWCWRGERPAPPCQSTSPH